MPSDFEFEILKKKVESLEGRSGSGCFLVIVVVFLWFALSSIGEKLEKFESRIQQLEQKP